MFGSTGNRGGVAGGDGGRLEGGGGWRRWRRWRRWRVWAKRFFFFFSLSPPPPLPLPLSLSLCLSITPFSFEMHAFRTKSESFEGALEDFLEWSEKTFPGSKHSIHDLRVSFNALLKRRKCVSCDCDGHADIARDSLVHIRSFKPSVKSDVWNYMYFSKKDDGTIDQERVTCVICGAVLKYRGNSTGDLRAHLATHPHEKEAHDRDETKSERSSLKRWLSSQRPLSQRKKKEIDDAILRFIVCGIQPFSVVGNESFKAILHLLEPRYDIPSRTTMSQVRLHDLYMQTLERTWVEKKNSIIACSLTVDGWSSNSDVHYMGITAHFIDDAWNFISLPLDFVPLSRSTGETVQEEMLDALERRGIDANKIVSITSDAGPDMRKGCTLLGTPHYLCILHGIHNAMQTGVGQSGMDPVFKRLKNIVSTFNRSPKAWACLQRKEREAGMERTKN